MDSLAPHHNYQISQKVTFYAASDSGLPATQEVDNENYNRDHKQQMDQSTGHMETKAQKP
jgi:hypothetical protein